MVHMCACSRRGGNSYHNHSYDCVERIQSCVGFYGLYIALTEIYAFYGLNHRGIIWGEGAEGARVPRLFFTNHIFDFPTYGV